MPVGVNILACDITHTREKVVIVATLNIEGFWFSEIDSAIKRCGGSLFYLKLRDKISRRHINDGELFFLSRDPDNYLMGNFDSVIFNFANLILFTKYFKKKGTINSLPLFILTYFNPKNAQTFRLLILVRTRWISEA